MISRLKPNWSILLQTVPGASRSVFLYSGIWLLASSSAPALIDTNENGVSDVWEEHYNSGDLFTAFDPNTDPDGDGWTNAQEAVTGTNPFDGNPPAGFLRPEIQRIPAVYQSPEDQGGEPTLLSPEALHIQWPTLAGKTYTLFSSVDLSAQTWLPYGGPRIGSGSTLGADIPLTQPDGSIPQALFLRVAVGDADTDGDGLTNAEEHGVGSSPYLADTNGNRIADGIEIAAGNDPSASTPDGNGDGVPDNVLYSVEFEVRHESRYMGHPLGYEVLVGTDPKKRYQVNTNSEEYSISDSPNYTAIEDGLHNTIHTYREEGLYYGDPAIQQNGTTLSDWKSENPVSLGEDEYLVSSTTQTAVTAPTTTASETFTTTFTTPWVVKKDVEAPGEDTVVRSGTATITVTSRSILTDPVTYQDLWTTYLKPMAWEESDESDPRVYGPHNWKDYNRLILGDAAAAEAVRDYFRNADFGVSATISAPGSSFRDYGSDHRLKSLRWRWVRFNPLTPFGLEAATPPASYQQRFHLLVEQRNFLRDRIGSPTIVTSDEVLTKGVVEIECKGSDGSGWHTVDLDKFSAYKLEEPTFHADLDFSNQGYSQTWFSLLPVKFRGYSYKERLETVGAVKGNYVSEKTREKINDSTDYTGFKTESKSELKIAQLSHKDLYDANNNHAFDHDEFKNDPDAFRIRLPDTPPPSGTAEHRVKIWTVDSAGNTVDAGAEADLNVFADFHETASLCLVTDDPEDDAFAVEGKADGALGDRTYRAVLDGKLKFQWLTFPGTGEKPIFEIPVPVKKTVTTKGFNVNGSTTTAAAYFDRAKLALSSCGVKLEYTVVNVAAPVGVSFGPVFEFTLPAFAGDIEITMSPESKALMDGCQPPEGVIPVYFLQNFNQGFTGWGNAPSWMAAADSIYGGGIFLDSPTLSESTLAHEFLHILLDASHGAVDPLWNHEHTSRPWCLWHVSPVLPPIEIGISARRRIVDSMRTRILKSSYCE